MITLHDIVNGQLVARAGPGLVGAQTVWIDLLNPTPDEDRLIEQAVGLDIPTRAETREIEASSRIYQENGAHYMTAFIVYNMDAALPASTTVTFILTRTQLITVRYHELKAFPLYLSRVEKRDATCTSAAAVMAGLIEAMVHRSADLVERIQDEVEKTVQQVFEIKGGQQTRGRRLDVLLRAAGRQGDINSRAQESAFSIERVLTHFIHVLKEMGPEKALVPRIEIVRQDVHSLVEHMRFLSSRIDFLLDATLGMINIEQNGIIKIFSVASVALMPPTLIASIYGMNFKHMPELGWPFGYPMAIGLMLVSAIVPFLYFRRKGWF